MRPLWFQDAGACGTIARERVRDLEVSNCVTLFGVALRQPRSVPNHDASDCRTMSGSRPGGYMVLHSMRLRRYSRDELVCGGVTRPSPLVLQSRQPEVTRAAARAAAMILSVLGSMCCSSGDKVRGSITSASIPDPTSARSCCASWTRTGKGPLNEPPTRLGAIVRAVPLLGTALASTIRLIGSPPTPGPE